MDGVLVHVAVFIDDLDQFKVVSFHDLEVIEVMGRRDLQRAGAELDVNVAVADNRDLFVDYGENHFLPDIFAVSGIIGVYSHGGVAQHRLRPRRRDGEVTPAAARGY